MSLAPLDPSARRQYSIDDAVRGVLVDGVKGASDAGEKGLRRGDVIVRAGGHEVANASDVAAAVSEWRKAGRASLEDLVGGVFEHQIFHDGQGVFAQVDEQLGRAGDLQDRRVAGAAWHAQLPGGAVVRRKTEGCAVQPQAVAVNDGCVSVGIAGLQRFKADESVLVGAAGHGRHDLWPAGAPSQLHFLACDGRQTVEAIVDRLAANHKLTFHESRLAVMQFLRMLMQRGAVAVQLPGGPEEDEG